MKRVNIRLVIILFLVAFFGTAGTYVLYRFQQQRLAKGLLLIVDQKLSEKDTDEAIQYLTMYTFKKPEDVEQVKRLAKIMKGHVDELTKRREMDAMKMSAAYSVLERAARLCPDDVEVQETIIEFLMPRRAFTDAIDYLRRLIDAHGEDAKPDWRLKLALCYHQIGDYDTSLPMFAEMVGWDSTTRSTDPEKATAPHNLKAYATLAVILRTQRNLPREADRVIEEMVKNNPEDYLAYVERARYLFTVGDDSSKEQVRQDVKKALQLASDKSEPLLLAAELALQDKDLVRARALYSRCHELHPDLYQPLVGLAQWSIRTENWDKAVEYLDDALQASPDNPDILYFKAMVQMEARNWQDFDKTLAEFRRVQGGNPLLKYLEGRRCILKEEWLKGSRMLAEVRQQVELLQPQLLDMLDRALAMAYQKLGQTDLQLAAMNNLVARHPDDIDLRILRSQCLVALRQENKAIGDYEYMEELLQADPEQAERRVAERLRLELLKQQQLPEKSRDWQKAAGLAEMLASRNDVNPALKQTLLQEFRKLTGQEGSTGDLESSSQLGALIARLNEIREAVFEKPLEEIFKELDEFEAGTGPILQTRLLRGEAIAFRKPENAGELLGAIEEAPDSFGDPERRMWQVELGRFYAQAGLQNEANRVWGEVLADDPNDIQLRLKLFELTLSSGDDAATNGALNGIEESVGRDSPEWRWARASQLAAQVRDGELPPDRLENALSLITEAKSSRGNWAQLYLLEGDIELIRQNPDAAVKAFERARRLGSENADALRNLVRLHYDRKQFDEARAALEELPRPLWGNRERQIQMHLLAMRGELPDDIDFTGMATDANGYTWLGRLMSDAGRPGKAEQAYRMALQMQPDSPAAWMGLINLAVTHKDKEQATQVLELAKAAVPERSKTSFLATAYRLMDDFAEAENYYRELLSERPDTPLALQEVASFYLQFGRRDQARPLLEKILANESDPAFSGVVRWARRMEALSIADQGGYENYQAAVQLLEANRDGNGPMDKEDLQLLGQLTIARPEIPSKRAALDQFKLARDARRLGFEESLFLAQLQDGVGDWQGCKKTMTELLADELRKNRANPEASQSLDLRILDPYLRLLLEHDDLVEASKWLENCAPDSGTAMRTRAHLLVRRGRYQQAIDLLKQLLGSQDGANEQSLRFVAGLAEELGVYDARMYAAAESAWRRLVTMQPASQPRYAEFLLRRSDPKRAGDIMQIVKGLNDSGQTLAAIRQTITLLRNHPEGLSDRDEYVRMVRSWLAAAKQADPSNSSLVIQEAELEGALGNEARQESLLRGYLAERPENDLARAIVSNNLAYIEAVKGNGPEAQRLVQEAVEILGPVSSLRDTIGMAHLASKQWEAAIDSFQTAIDQGQQSAISRYHLARALWNNGQQQPAAEAMELAVSMGLKESDFSPSEFRQYEEFVKELESAGFTMPAEKTTAKPGVTTDQPI